MAEFDFDELDKAVNSLMQKQTGTQPASDNASTSSVTQAPSSTDTPVAHTAENNTEADAIPERSLSSGRNSPDNDNSPSTPVASRPSLAVKRRGKFMDVVHPSMPSSTTTAPRKTAPVRSGVPMEPINNITSPTPTSPSAPRAVDGISQPPGVNSTVSESVKPDQVDKTSSGSDWPDPLEAMERQEAIKVNSANKQSVVDSKPVEKTFADSEMEATSVGKQDLSSPFLPDAKVEKRPLGAPAIESTETSQGIGSSNESAKSSADIGDELKADDSEDKTSNPVNLPEEFNADVLSLESHDTSQQAASMSNDASSDSQTDATPNLGTEGATSPSTQATQPVQPSPTPSTTTSIVGSLPPRQASNSNNNNHDEEPKSSIFDTDDSHPMKHQTKRSSGWFAVVIIGSMLLIGAIGGVVVYLLDNGY